MEFRHKYGVIGAGPVAKSLVGRLPAKGVDIGPVSAVTYRVASRIANALKSGFAVREPLGLRDAAVVLFHAPPDQLDAMVELLFAAKIQWPGRSLIFCDCLLPPAIPQRFRHEGASVAVVREFGLAGRVLLEGAGRGLLHANRLAREAQLKPIEIHPGGGDLFDAAVTLSTSAITPLVDRAAALLRAAGVRETEAPRLASALVEQTAAGYAHSGKQSWAWYLREPDAQRILAEADAAEAETRDIFRALLLFGLDLFEKHPELAAALRTGPPA